ncbi:hypothetical protein ACOME3_007875 [Neoechinorhynchus agilis]
MSKSISYLTALCKISCMCLSECKETTGVPSNAKRILECAFSPDFLKYLLNAGCKADLLNDKVQEACKLICSILRASISYCKLVDPTGNRCEQIAKMSYTFLLRLLEERVDDKPLDIELRSGRFLRDIVNETSLGADERAVCMSLFKLPGPQFDMNGIEYTLRSTFALFTVMDANYFLTDILYCFGSVLKALTIPNNQTQGLLIDFEIEGLPGFSYKARSSILGCVPSDERITVSYCSEDSSNGKPVKISLYLFQILIAFADIEADDDLNLHLRNALKLCMDNEQMMNYIRPKLCKEEYSVCEDLYKKTERDLQKA